MIIIMRVDKFLKVSRLIKRRTVANDACSAGRVTVNDKIVKPGAEVAIGDILSFGYGDKKITIRILNLKEHVLKDDANGLYEVVES